VSIIIVNVGNQLACRNLALTEKQDVIGVDGFLINPCFHTISQYISAVCRIKINYQQLSVLFKRHCGVFTRNRCIVKSMEAGG